MKTLKEIQNEVARSREFRDWECLATFYLGMERYSLYGEATQEVASRYAFEVAKEALKSAVQSAKSAAMKERSMSRVYLKMYEAIESEANIPQELRNTISNNG